MNAKNYIPRLIDTTNVNFPEELKPLVESLSENFHDMWVLERQSEGWTFGPKRDDSKLESPDMVPYSQLPESKKEYDRYISIGTLKLIMKLGFNITR